MHSTILTNEYIQLRFVNENDAIDIVKWKNSSEVNKYLFGNPDYQIKDFIYSYNQEILKNKSVQFIIETLVEKEKIGTIFIRNIHENNKKGEIGYFIGESNQRGKGYGKQAVELMVKYGFEVLGLNKIYMQAFEDNVASIRCCEHVGFVREGLHLLEIYKDGDFRNIVTMAIFNPNKKAIRNE